MNHWFLPFHHRALSPQNITGLLQCYAEYAHKYIWEAINKMDGQSSPLVPFVLPPAYYSAGYAFFGRAFNAEKSYEPFKIFDNQFHLFAAGVPKFLMPGPRASWNQIGEIFEQYLESPHEDCCELISGMIRGARDANWVCNSFHPSTNLFQ